MAFLETRAVRPQVVWAGLGVAGVFLLFLLGGGFPTKNVAWSASSYQSLPRNYEVTFMTGLLRMWHHLAELERRVRSVGPGTPVGNVAYQGAEVTTYYLMASKNNLKSICESGFGSGHSTVIYLSANAEAKVLTFDLGLEEHNGKGFKAAGLAYINEMFPQRHSVVWGDAKKQIVLYNEQHPEHRCDLVVVDGDHSQEGQYEEIVAFRKFSDKNGLILVDMDYGGLTKAVNEGLVSCVAKWQESQTEEQLRKGFGKNMVGGLEVSWLLCLFAK